MRADPDDVLGDVAPLPRTVALGAELEEVARLMTDYDLTIVTTVHAEHDYGWLNRCPAVLDCTYRTPGGRQRFLP